MKNIQDLKGCGTALVTPFSSDGKIDETAFRNFVDFQIREGINFLVPCGTTGESVTMSQAEHLRVVEIVLEQSAGKVPVIAGAGGYNTAHVIDMAKEVAGLGVDAILSVTPYYNKPTQEGLFQHYKAIAEAVQIPIIVYNVPTRTSTNILPDTVVRLSEIENIVGLKAASGNIGQISEMAMKMPENFIMLSGDDVNTIPIISLGGRGVISVVSNLVPKMMVKLIDLCLKSNYKKAIEHQRTFFKLMKVIFLETNPIPVKAGLAMMELIEANYRLPLVPMSEQNRETLKSVMIDIGVI